ncbi:MAG: hypothetical protein M3Q34_03110 [bacterium]|nr:hypothetical protein [bacterium]
MIPQYFAYITIFTSIFAGYFYIRDTLLGKTKPNIVSWFIWFLAPNIAAIVSLSKGGGLAMLPIFMATFTPFAVICIALFKKNAVWKVGILDYVCLALSLLAIVVWLFLEEGNLATAFAILADLIAFIPTFVKSWKSPDSETLGPYFSGMLNPVITVLTLTALSFNTYGFAFYLFLGNFVEIIIVYFRRRYLSSRN